METALGAQLQSQEGTVAFRGYRVWYRRIVGAAEDRQTYPLLCLHGGPGFPHDYLEPLEKLAANGREVILYDQLGCGNSDQPHDPSMWTVELFTEELGVLRKFLNLERLHLLGHSWGGMLAQAYALTKPEGLLSLVLSSTAASIPQFLSEARALLRNFPREIQETIAQHEAAGTTDSPAYQEAALAFYRQHFIRTDPWPEYMNRAFDKYTQNPEVYESMWGPSEFHCTGILKSWDVAKQLGEIRVPTLIISGRHDEATPACAELLHKGIKGSRWELFEHSAHMVHIDEEEKYLRTVNEFLESVESQMRRDSGTSA